MSDSFFVFTAFKNISKDLMLINWGDNKETVKFSDTRQYNRKISKSSI